MRTSTPLVRTLPGRASPLPPSPHKALDLPRVTLSAHDLLTASPCCFVRNRGSKGEGVGTPRASAPVQRLAQERRRGSSTAPKVWWISLQNESAAVGFPSLVRRSGTPGLLSSSLVCQGWPRKAAAARFSGINNSTFVRLVCSPKSSRALEPVFPVLGPAGGGLRQPQRGAALK